MKSNICYASAIEIFNKSTRFDLIFKYLYAKNKKNSSFFFYKEIYLRSIEAFNGFYEEKPSKQGSQDFIESFDVLVESIEVNGYLEDKELLTVTDDGELYDGAHRLATAAAFNIDVPVARTMEIAPEWGYKFFSDRGLDSWILDFGALEFIKINKSSRLVVIYPCVSDDNIEAIERGLELICKIYYKKEINLSLCGLTNLKKILYQGDHWIGTSADEFKGARSHAKSSFGLGLTYIYVVVGSENLSDELAIFKRDLRKSLGLGNFPIHTTDDCHDTVRASEYLLNSNSVNLLNYLSLSYDFSKPDYLLESYISSIDETSPDRGAYCIVGSYVLELYNIRSAKDLDYITYGVPLKSSYSFISLHDDDESYFVNGFSRQILDPRLFLYFFGVKVMSVQSLLVYKSRRFEIPKDIDDIFRILDCNPVLGKSTNISLHHNKIKRRHLFAKAKKIVSYVPGLRFVVKIYRKLI